MESQSSNPNPQSKEVSAIPSLVKDLPIQEIGRIIVTYSTADLATLKKIFTDRYIKFATAAATEEERAFVEYLIRSTEGACDTQAMEWVWIAWDYCAKIEWERERRNAGEGEGPESKKEGKAMEVESEEHVDLDQIKKGGVGVRSEFLLENRRGYDA